MISIDRPPVPERELAPQRHAAIRALLVAEAAPRPAKATAEDTPHTAEAAGRPAPRRWRVVTRRPALVAGLAAAVLIAGQLWPLPTRFDLAAGWTAEPQPADQITADQVSQACAEFPTGPRQAPDPSSWQAAVVDLRGHVAVAALTTESRDVRVCTFLGVGQALAGGHPLRDLGGGSGTGSYRPLAAGELVRAEGWGKQTLYGPQYATGEVYGQVASEVAEVRVVLDDGSTVSATVDNGWFIAWWPGQVHRALLWRWAETPSPVTIEAYGADGALLAEVAAVRDE